MNTLIFQEALGEDDEYQRLSKITDGIKQVAGAIMRVGNFNSPELLKYMICSYPFQQEAIKLLMNTIFDYFQDLDFLNAFEKALLEVSQLQEQRVFLSSRSQSLRIGVLQQHYNNYNIRSEQLKQGIIPFSKTVVEQLTVAKRFAASFIQRYLELAKQLGEDLKERVFIIKNFVTGTRDHHFIIVLINIFEGLKENVLRDLNWVPKFDQEIESYCHQHNIIIPHYVDKRRVHLQEKESSEADSKSQSDLEDSDDSKPKSDSESKSDERMSEIDEEEFIQNWLSQKSPKIEQQHADILQREENLAFLLSFLFNPNKEEIMQCWSQQYPQHDIKEDNVTNKLRNQPIEFYNTIRSYKTTMLLSSRENLEKILQVNQTFLFDFFNSMQEAFLDQERNLNLCHLTTVIDSCLQILPKNTMIRMFENRIFFFLSHYIYNPYVLGLLIDIHFLQIDKYAFGITFQQLIWKHQLYTNWFQYLQNVFLNNTNDQKILDKNVKNETIDQILSNAKDYGKSENKVKPKSIANEVKTKLTEMFGSLQAGKTLQEANPKDFEDWKSNLKVIEYLTLKEFDGKDIDNLKGFIKGRDNIYKQQMEHKIQAQLDQQIESMQNKRVSRIRMSQTQYQQQLSPRVSGKVFQQVSSPNSNRSIKLPSLQASQTEIRYPVLSTFASAGDITIFESKIRNNSQLGQSPKQTKLVIASQRRLKTDMDEQDRVQNGSNDGFSSSRLITIYPTKQALLKLQQSKLLQKTDQLIVSNSLTFYKEIILSILEYFRQPNKSNLQQLNESILIQQILSMEFMNSLFELYLASLIDTSPQQQKIGEQCGNIINLIYEKCHDIELFDLLREQLRTIFICNVDYLTRAIVAINKQTRPQLKQASKCQQLLVLSTYFYGFNLFSIHSQLITTQNIYKHLNETVMHIFIIWFFDSDQNNVFQHFFSKFLTILFAKAPIQQLTNILFNLGMVNSLYNALQSFFVNGIKSSSFKSGIYYYMSIIVYVIDKSLKHRNFTVLIDYLKPLNSWRGIFHLIPEEESNFMIELTELLKTGQTPIRKIEFAQNKVNRLKQQITIEINENKSRELKQFQLLQQQNALKSQSAHSTPTQLKAQSIKHLNTIKKSNQSRYSLKTEF